MNILSFDLIKIITQKEENYQKTIQNITIDTRRVLELYQELNTCHTRFSKFLTNLIKSNKKQNNNIQLILETYHDALNAHHQDNIQIMAVYCDMFWPADLDFKNSKKLRQSIRTIAEDVWKQWGEDRKQDGGLTPAKAKILDLKNECATLEKNSSYWRSMYHSLRQRLFDEVVATLNEHKMFMNKRFKIMVFSSSITQNQGYQSHNIKRRIRRLADSIKGYVPFSKQAEADYTAVKESQLLKNLSAFVRRLYFMLGTRYFLVGIIILSMVLFFRMSGLDSKFYESVTLEVKKLLKLDPVSLAQKQKKQFFQRQIDSISENYSNEILLQRLEDFKEAKFKNSSLQHLYFAQEILMGYFLLLSDQSEEYELTEELLYVAYDLNPEIAVSLKNIIRLFNRSIIRESKLRKEMLQLRAGFVKRGVFPFMFLTLKKDQPYLFLFPERVLHHYVLSEEVREKLQLDRRRYFSGVEKPIVGYVVPGNLFPFRDRAGYFEGEFAVIFKNFAPNMHWTAYHELGHVVDHLKHKFERKPKPENIELNAMLFPIMFDETRKEYIELRLKYAALRQDKHDFYAQSAKGILNGFEIYFNEGQSVKDNIITNQFEIDRINNITDKILSFSSKEIGDIALAMYRNPEEYLFTTGTGRHLHDASGVTEIITGAHTVAQRGFVLGGFGFGFGKGPMFIREGGGGEGSDIPFEFWAFISSILHMVFVQREAFAHASKAQAIAASVFVFLAFNGFSILLHCLGTPIRRRKYYGRDIKKIIDRVYQNNKWSTGLSFGDEENERKLLKNILSADGKVNDETKNKIKAYKATATPQQRLLFDMILLLASLNPQKSFIRNKAHDILFYLPFIGPYIARSHWLYAGQRPFNLREQYNRKLEQLIMQADSDINQDQLLDQLDNIIGEFAQGNTGIDGDNKEYDNVIDKLQARVMNKLKTYRRKPMRFKQQMLVAPITNVSDQGSEFDRLDKYHYGDDIRHIDWNATARLANSDVMVRKFRNLHGAKVGFLLDMRNIHESKQQDLWVEDFMKTLAFFEKDQLIERLIFITPDGLIHESVINLRFLSNVYMFIIKIFNDIKKNFSVIMSEKHLMHIEGLKFYTDSENETFKQILALTDFSQAGKSINIAPVKAKQINVFAVGCNKKDYGTIEKIIGERNKVFYKGSYDAAGT